MTVHSNIKNTVFHAAAALLFEQPARRMSMDRIIDRLEHSWQTFEKRAARSSGRHGDQRILAHMIGVERWAQRQMGVALGQPAIQEGPDRYYPERMEWKALQEAFRATRQATIGLTKTLRMAGIDPNQPIAHTHFGEISLAGWLLYLDLHTRFESLQLR